MGRRGTVQEKPGKKAQAHIQYYNKEGVLLPGCTAITGLLDKSGPLIWWAWKLGKQNVKPNEYRDQLADAGTLAHYLVMCELTGTAVDEDYIAEFSGVDRDRADNALCSFYNWQKLHKIEPVFNEKPLVSEAWQFGGTLDFYAAVDGLLTLVDLKTGKAIYSDYYTQVAGYYKLLTENGYKVGSAIDPTNGQRGKQVFILRIGRDESEGFEYKKVPSLNLHLKRFKNLRDQYRINQDLKKLSAA